MEISLHRQIKRVYKLIGTEYGCFFGALALFVGSINFDIHVVWRQFSLSANLVVPFC